MTVTSVWVGAVTDSSARVVGKVDGSSVRLAVADNEQMSDPQFFGPETPTAQDVVSVEATGLDPDTRYHFALEVDSALDTEFPGRFRTHPTVGEPASFRFAMATCAGSSPRFPGQGAALAGNRLSNHPVFDRIREHDPLMFLHGGDLHYYDLGSNNHGIVGGGSLGNYRRAYDDVLLQPRQHRLYREVPLVYAYDDHDWGPNNSDGTIAGRDNALQVYRERVPHYPLGDPAVDAPVYHAFQVGRVLFVIADVRADRSPNSVPDGPGKTMLGAAQKAWMEALLDDYPAELLAWLVPSQWMGSSTDSWASFGAERKELVEMLGDLGWLGRMFILSGDQHQLGIDTGGNSPGGIPVFQFASLDSSSGNPATHMDSGPNSPGRNRYGTVDITDNGHRVEATASGWIGRWRWRSHTFDVSTSTPKVHLVREVQEVSARATVDFGEPDNPDTFELEAWSVDREIATELPDQVRQTSGVSAASASLAVPAPSDMAPGWWSPWLRMRRSTGRPVTVEATVDDESRTVFVGQTLDASAEARGQSVGLRCADDVWRLRSEVTLPAFTGRIASAFNPGIDPVWVIEHVLRHSDLTPLPLTGPEPLVVASLAGSAMPSVGGFRGTQSGSDPPAFEDRDDLPLPAMTGDADVPVSVARWSVLGEDVEPWPTEVTVGFIVGAPGERLPTEAELAILTLRGGGVNAGRLVFWVVPDNDQTWIRVFVMDGPSFPADVIADVTFDDLDLGLTWLVLRKVGTDLEFEAFQHGARVAEAVLPFWVSDPEIDHVIATCEGSVPLSTVQVLAWAPDKLAEPGSVLDFTSDASQFPAWDPEVFALADRPTLPLVGVPPLGDVDGASVLRDLAHADQSGAWFAEDGRPVWRNRDSLRGEGQEVIDVTSTTSLVDFRWAERVEQIARSVQAQSRAPEATQHDPETDVYTAGQVFSIGPGQTLDIVVDLEEPSGVVDETMSGSSATVGSRYKANRKADGSGSEVAQIHRIITGPGPGGVVVGKHRVTLISPMKARIELENVTGFTFYLVDTSGNPALFVGAAVTVTEGQATTVRRETGVDTPNTLDLGANPWRQDVDSTGDLVGFVAAEVSVPRPVTQSVEIVPDLDVTLGSVVRLHDPDVSGLSVRGLVRSVRWQARAGELTQVLEVQPLRPTLGEHDLMMGTDLTLGEHDAEMDGQTLRDHDERPIHPLDPSPTFGAFDRLWEGQTLGDLDGFWSGETMGDLDAEPLRS